MGLSEHEYQEGTEELAELRGRIEELESRLEEREAQFRRTVELLREEKQAALMKLAGSVSHDVSNVLVAVLGFSDLLLSKLSPDDPSHRSIRMIQDAGNRGVELSRRLLDFSRRRPGRMEELEPDVAIGELMELLPWLLPPHAAVALQPGAEGYRVNFDREVFRTIILMAVLNGATHASAAGVPEVTMRTGHFVQETFADTGASLAPGTYWFVHVDAGGHSVTEEEGAGLCDPLNVGPGGAEDYGVGYAYARKALQLVGGAIIATPLEGSGTRVSIYVPAVLPSPQSGGFTSLADLGHTGPPPTILVVDDEDIVRQIVVRTLARAGFEVVEARDGEEALALVDEAPNRFHLVLTDLVMPRMDGRTLAEKIEGRISWEKIVFMSGYTGEQLEIRRPGAKAVHFIAKPFRPGALVDVIYRAMGLALARG